MLVAIHQPNFLPRPKVIDKMLAADLTIYLDDVQYVPREWQNRALIRAPRGEAHWLSIPTLTKGRSRPLIMQCQVAESPIWRRKHLATIRQLYAKSPWLPLFEDRLGHLWYPPIAELASFCIDTTESLTHILGHAVQTRRAHEIEIEADSAPQNGLLSGSPTTAPDGEVEADALDRLEKRTARLVHLCEAVGATGYLCGSGGFAYLQLDQFRKAGIAVFLQRDPEANVTAWRRMSTLDAILTRGPQATLEHLLARQYDEL